MSSRFEVRVTAPARRDMAAIVRWSRKEFGQSASQRYEALLMQAVMDIGEDPERPGSMERPEISKRTRTYPLWFSRARVKGPRVKAPRHLLLYRIVNERVIEIGRILHDASDLERHLPEGHERD